MQKDAWAEELLVSIHGDAKQGSLQDASIKVRSATAALRNSLWTMKSMLEVYRKAEQRQRTLIEQSAATSDYTINRLAYQIYHDVVSNLELEMACLANAIRQVTEAMSHITGLES